MVALKQRQIDRLKKDIELALRENALDLDDALHDESLPQVSAPNRKKFAATTKKA